MMVKEIIPIIIILFVANNFQLAYSALNVRGKFAGLRNTVKAHTKEAKALARYFCEGNELTFTKTPLTNDDVLMNARYQTAYNAIIDYCQVSATGEYGETEEHVRRYVVHCLTARLTPEQCAEVIVTLNKNGWKFMSTATLLTRLNNHRYFLIERGFQRINMKEKFFLKYQIIPHLDVHACCYHFNPQTSKQIETAMSTYDSAYDSDVHDLAAQPNTVYCKCYEVIGYDEIFVIIFKSSRDSMVETHRTLCFTASKFANWSENQITLIVQAARDNTRFTRDDFMNFLQFALILATSTWGESNWTFEFIFDNLPDVSLRDDYNTTLSLMHEAIDIGIGEIDYRRFITDTDLPRLGYNAPLCRYKMLQAIIYSNSPAQIRNRTPRQLWRNNRKSEMIDHIVTLFEYASYKEVDCDEFTTNLPRLEAALLLNDWEPLLIQDVIRKVHNTGTDFYQAIFCIRILAVMEHRLRSRHQNDALYNMRHELTRTEDNLETLLDMNGREDAVLHCENLQELVDGDINGAEFLLQIIVGARNMSEPYGSLIPNVGTI